MIDFQMVLRADCSSRVSLDCGEIVSSKSEGRSTLDGACQDTRSALWFDFFAYCVEIWVGRDGFVHGIRASEKHVLGADSIARTAVVHLCNILQSPTCSKKRLVFHFTLL